MYNYPLYCGGKFIETEIPLVVKSSYDNSIVGNTFLARATQLEDAIAAATSVKTAMAQLPSWKKYRILLQIADQLSVNSERMADIICREASKPIRFAISEVERAIQTFIVAAEESKRIEGDVISIDWTPAGEGREGIVKWVPSGIIAGISPFNFPLNLAVHKIAPAIAAGCPIILKPARSTPLSTLFLAQLIDQTDLPKGALSILPMDRFSGNQLVTDERFSVLSFTGSPEVGWKMKQQSGHKKVVLELGGNAGVIIHSDADVDNAVKRCIGGAFAYSGQVCIHAQRFYIHESIFQEFSNKFVLAVKLLKKGEPWDPSTSITSMIDESNAARVQSWVDEAVANGAKCLCGGSSDGAFFEPTVMINAKREMKICELEIFGPVVTFEPYSMIEDAFDLINDSRYGLQAGIFTNGIKELNKAFSILQVGGVIHNDVPTFRVDHMPYGGIKESGIGREGVKYAIRDYMEMKLLVKEVD